MIESWADLIFQLRHVVVGLLNVHLLQVGRWESASKQSERSASPSSVASYQHAVDVACSHGTPLSKQLGRLMASELTSTPHVPYTGH